MIYTHSHVDHWGGVLGVISAADVTPGRVKVYAPAGCTQEALSENLFAGTAAAAAARPGRARSRRPPLRPAAQLQRWPSCHGWAGWRPRSWSWWITLLNLTGSIAFGVSAVAGYINPSTGQIHNAELTNLGTFTGALCFLAGALLLMPERTGETSPAVPAPAPSGT